MRPWLPVAAVALTLSPLVAVHPVRIEGRSMEPVLRGGDLRWAVRAWAAPSPKRGEVWVVEGPSGSSIKRVIGLPGEVVAWNGPDLWIGDRRLDEPWVVHPERSGEGRQACGEGYLVLGDNRPDSRDGRAWGSLPKAALKARLLGGSS
ncbi:signal peptidase I [Geothrix sp. 21YS21S-4]|uniref:signal peptidase I n=1 Tax=Geothrix sp. 21YS21S-4 TaxID=3068889 RepID=UPI0027BAC1F7|nr:signal peptidase I [Geothrix sp. 21YS21S-4]